MKSIPDLNLLKRALCGLAVALTSLGASAQTHYTLNGTDYELITWPSAAVGTNAITSDTASAAYGAISIGVTGQGMQSDPTAVADFYNAPVYAGAGYGITGTPLFRVNNGQSEPAGNDITVSYAIAATQLPTELIFYAGGADVGGYANSGLKYARWSWASSQAGTQFEVLANTPSFVVSGSGTSTLSWQTYGSDNNTAMALVRITNPAGISNFTVTSNRLTAAGADNVYGSVNQRADYNGIAILVAQPVAPPAGNVQAVPALEEGGLALLLVLIPMAATLVGRRRNASR